MVTLYTNNCPACRVLKRRLDELGIEYSTLGEKEIVELGYDRAPLLKVGEKIMEYPEALRFLQKHGRN